MFVKYYLVLVLVAYGTICCLLMFSRGFLLSRNVIDSKSLCEGDAEVGEGPRWDTVYQRCPSTGNKVIMVVVDALRFDFVVRVEGADRKTYHNRFEFVQSLLSDRSRSRLYKFVADPPTTTMQRLHGITTGSLPTFVDVGSNFASSAITEDNLLWQLKRHGKNTVFLGDDTWLNLFPESFHRVYPYPSFDVWDLDTVDRGVNRDIVSEIRKTDWDLLIAHYLGVDHCGHRYGARHPEMARKLKETDDVVREVVRVMDNDTVLLVFGDHGMTENGDHGGDSYEEVTSAIFVYSPVPLNPGGSRSSGSVSQIDLLPTLSSILGVPIPYSNLGSLVLEFIPSLRSLDRLALLNNNIDQITNYIKRYHSVTRHFPQHLYDGILSRYSTLKASSHLDNFTGEADAYLRSVQDMCRSVWTQFDFTSIFSGLLWFLFFLVLIVSIYLGPFCLERLDVKTVTLYFFTVSSLFFMKSLSRFSQKDLYFYSFSCLGIMLLLVNCFNFRSVSFKRLLDFELGLRSWLSFIVFVSSFIGQLSNSFIVKEDRVVTFLLTTMALSICFEVLSHKKRVVVDVYRFRVTLKQFTCCLTLFFCVTLRLLSYFWQCYDDQSPHCTSSKSPTAFFSSFTLLSILAFYFNTVVNYLKSNFKFGTVEKIKLLLLIMCSFCLMADTCLPSDRIDALGRAKNMLLRIVCFVSLASVLLCLVCPRYILVDSIKKLDVTDITSDGPSSSKIYCLVYFQFSMFVWFLSLVVSSDGKTVSSIVMFLSVGMLLVVSGIDEVVRPKDRSVSSVSFIQALMWHLSGLVHFYGTGHQPSFASLQWDAVAPFTSLPVFIPGLLIIVNTFISQLLHSLLLPLLSLVPFSVWESRLPCPDTVTRETCWLKNHKYRRRYLFSSFVLCILLQSCRVFVIMLSATVHARHLMVWKVFAPKFIFEAVGFIVTLVFLLVSFGLVERISSHCDEDALRSSKAST